MEEDCGGNDFFKINKVQTNTTKDIIHQIKWSPKLNERRILTGSWTEASEVTLWEMSENEEFLDKLSSASHSGRVRCMNWLGNGDFCITGSTNGSVTLFSIGKGDNGSGVIDTISYWSKLFSFENVDRSLTYDDQYYFNMMKGCCVQAIATSPLVEDTAVCSGVNGQVKVLDLFRQRNVIHEWKENDENGVKCTCSINDIHYSNDNNFIIYGVNNDGNILVFDKRQRTSEKFHRPNQYHQLDRNIIKDAFIKLDVHPINSNLMAVAAMTGPIHLFDIRQLDLPVTTLGTNNSHGHKDCVWDICFANSDHLYSCGEDGLLFIWEIGDATVTPSHLIPPLPLAINSIDVKCSSFLQHKLISATDNNCVHFLNISCKQPNSFSTS
ncbi:hypothetical protein SNEBB_008517 [Seison nebaliae]|nr:hypothetical protein SNEBB_008517 [Seison nebaliae]